MVWLANEKLYYVGEQCEFALDREQVEEIYCRDVSPTWLTEKALYLKW